MQSQTKGKEMTADLTLEDLEEIQYAKSLLENQSLARAKEAKGSGNNYNS